MTQIPRCREESPDAEELGWPVGLLGQDAARLTASPWAWPLFLSQVHASRVFTVRARSESPGPGERLPAFPQSLPSSQWAGRFGVQ